MVNFIDMDEILKIKSSIDALFGAGISKNLPNDLKLVFSKKNGRIRTVYQNENLLFTLRIDGGIAITPYFAQLLMKNKKFKQNCVEIEKEAAPFVLEGKSVFCKHVIWCGKNVQISSETPIIYQNKIIAVGKAVLSAEMIEDFERGIAVKIRDSLKSTN